MRYLLEILYLCGSDQRYRRRHPAGVFILALIWGTLIGCSPVEPPPPFRWAPPLLPLAPQAWTPAQARDFYHDCFNHNESLDPAAPLAELLLTYRSVDRDFRESAGPDGYVLQVIPLDHKYQPLQLQGHLTIILFAEPALKPDGSIGQPLYIWRIPAQDLVQYWTPTHLLQGYLVRLDWGRTGPGPGNYEFLVRLTYKNKNVFTSVCRALSFREQLNI